MYNKGDNRMRRNIESLLGSGKKAFITKLKSYIKKSRNHEAEARQPITGIKKFKGLAGNLKTDIFLVFQMSPRRRVSRS
jgi:hypothetical protein